MSKALVKLRLGKRIDTLYMLYLDKGGSFVLIAAMTSVVHGQGSIVVVVPSVVEVVVDSVVVEVVVVVVVVVVVAENVILLLRNEF